MITFSDFCCDWRCFPEESYDLDDLDIAHVMAIVKPKAGRVGSPEDILQLLRREFVCWSLPPHVERLVGQLWQAYESDAAFYGRIAAENRKDEPMLEEEIKKLRIAIEDLNETLKKGGGASASQSGLTRKEDKPASSRKGDDKPASSRKDDKGKGPTFDEFKKACAEFTSADLDDKEFEYRVTRVLKPIFEKYDVKKASELPEDSWQETLDAIDDFYAEEDERRRREEEDDRGSSRGRSSRDDDRGSSRSREDDDRGPSRSRSSREDDDRGSSRGRSSGGSRGRSTRG
jgi:hypothetical protein